MACLGDEEIAELVEGRLSATRAAAAAEHLAGCPACRALVGGLAGAVAPADAPRDEAFTLQPVDPAQYEVGRELARGGMGRIFEAWDRRHQRVVAIKLLLDPAGGTARRFVREARITARLQHPSIVPLYEAGRWPSGEPFIAMKRVRGRPLSEAITATGSLDERLALLSNVIAVTEALAYAHEEGVVHRDLKPSNVLVGAFGETVVIDWGLAKEEGVVEEAAADGPGDSGGGGDAGLTLAGHALGTPFYMAPEQARGAGVDARADVYSLGALLYHVLAREPPYAGGSEDVLADVLAGPPAPLARRVPEVPPDLSAIVDKAMARDPGARYPTAKAMAADLHRFADGGLVSAHHYSAGTLLGRWVRRHRTLVAMAAALVVAAGATGGLSVGRIVAARAEAERARQTAVTERDAAEKLVEFVIGRLKDRLEGLGKLELLAGIGDEVVSYYRTLAPGDSGAHGRRAAAFASLAEVAYKRRNFAQAEPLAREAVSELEQAARREPADRELALRLVAAQVVLANVLLESRAEGALAAAQAADALASDLVAGGPSDPRLWIAAAYARGTLAYYLVSHGDQPRARELAASIEGRLARAGDLDALEQLWQDRAASAYGTLGNITIGIMDYARMEKAFAAHNALRRKALATRPDHVAVAGALSYGLRALGMAKENLGKKDEALASYREGIDLRARLLEREPENLTLQIEQGIALSMICRTELTWRTAAEAARDCEAASAVCEAVARARPGDTSAQDALGRALRALGHQQLAAHRHAEAQASFTRALDVARRVAARDANAGALAGTVAVTLADLAHAERLLGHLPAARAALLEAAAINEKLYGAGFARDFIAGNLGAVLDPLADLEQAQGDAAQARAHRDRATVLLEEALAGSPGDVDYSVTLAEVTLKLAALERDATRRQALRTRADELVAPLLAAGQVPPQQRAELATVRAATK